ncbi:MAG: hypothetical protein GY719_29145 [bacterium]|nr:hypothetical protein [bacterium]
MSKGTCRNAIAALTLALCLLLAVPQSADAGLLEPSQRAEGVNELERGVTLWESIWSSIRSLWGRSGIFIDPYGQDDGDRSGIFIDPYGQDGGGRSGIFIDPYGKD